MKEFLPEGRLYRTEENQRLLRTAEGVYSAWEHHTLVEAQAQRCDQEHNLWVTLGPWEAKIPREETALGISDGSTRDIAIMPRVGRPVCFYIEALEGQDGAIVPRLSWRAAQAEALAVLLRRRPGEIIPATITHLEPFGAFVDVGCGLPSMISIEQISVSRIPHPSARFQEGQEIFALITGLSPEQGRVTLSHRELLGTWAENAARFQSGETVPGIVRSIQDYGAFVELTPNLSGLTEQYAGLNEGDWVAVCIKSIIPKRMKIKLSVISKLQEPPPPTPLKYYLTSGFLPRWQYAPADSPRQELALWDVTRLTGP